MLREKLVLLVAHSSDRSSVTGCSYQTSVECVHYTLGPADMAGWGRSEALSTLRRSETARHADSEKCLSRWQCPWITALYSAPAWHVREPTPQRHCHPSWTSQAANEREASGGTWRTGLLACSTAGTAISTVSIVVLRKECTWLHGRVGPGKTRRLA